MRDIRDHLPRTPQTDPNKFPAYKYRPYPRMMKDEDGKPYKTAMGKEVIVNSEAEENEFLGKLPEPIEAKTVSIDPTKSPEHNLNTLAEKRKPEQQPKTKLPKDLKS